MLSYNEKQKLEHEIQSVTENIARLEAEKDEVYKSVQDFTVSANKTSAAIARIKNLKTMIDGENRKLERLKSKL